MLLFLTILLSLPYSSFLIPCDGSDCLRDYGPGCLRSQPGWRSTLTVESLNDLDMPSVLPSLRRWTSNLSSANDTLPLWTLDRDCFSLVHTSPALPLGCSLPSRCGVVHRALVDSSWLGLKQLYLCYATTAIVPLLTQHRLFTLLDNPFYDSWNITRHLYVVQADAGYAILPKSCSKFYRDDPPSITDVTVDDDHLVHITFSSRALHPHMCPPLTFSPSVELALRPMNLPILQLPTYRPTSCLCQTDPRVLSQCSPDPNFYGSHTLLAAEIPYMDIVVDIYLQHLGSSALSGRVLLTESIFSPPPFNGTDSLVVTVNEAFLSLGDVIKAILVDVVLLLGSAFRAWVAYSFPTFRTIFTTLLTTITEEVFDVFYSLGLVEPLAIYALVYLYVRDLYASLAISAALYVARSLIFPIY